MTQLGVATYVRREKYRILHGYNRMVMLMQGYSHQDKAKIYSSEQMVYANFVTSCSSKIINTKYLRICKASLYTKNLRETVVREEQFAIRTISRNGRVTYYNGTALINISRWTDYTTVGGTNWLQ